MLPSTVVCVPASLNENGPALGAQAGEVRIAEIVKSAGFSKFRRATQTPFNFVLKQDSQVHSQPNDYKDPHFIR